MNAKKELQAWLDELSNFKTPDFDALPDIDLYMDQVITYMERQLKVFMKDEEDKIITSSMINNYVKGNVIPSPISKKYSNKHLAYIITVCSLKQILPIIDVSKLLNTNESFDDFYKFFKESQDQTINKTCSDVKKALTGVKKEFEDDELRLLALKLTIEANTYKNISERILYILEQKRLEEIEELRKKTTKEEKKQSADSKKKVEKTNTETIVEENIEA